VLVVDPDSSLLGVLELVLLHYGMSVDTASSVPEATSLLTETRPDVVVLDTTFLAALAAGEICVGAAGLVVTVSDSGSRGEVEAVRLGALAHLRKPYRIESLVALLRSTSPFTSTP
jgi:DNA-binding response OmpR family regulator